MAIDGAVGTIEAVVGVVGTCDDATCADAGGLTAAAAAAAYLIGNGTAVRGCGCGCGGGFGLSMDIDTGEGFEAVGKTKVREKHTTLQRRENRQSFAIDVSIEF